MLKTLKITSLLIAVAALAVVVTLGILGMRGDKKIEDYLSKPSAVELFRENVKPDSVQTDKISPLVTQANKYALRLNPPKPQPRTAVANRATSRRSTSTGREPVPVVAGPKVNVNVKFKLVATCRYEDQPEKSLALVNLTSKGNKWFGQGDTIGNLTIHDIKDGSIVLYQGDAENSLLEMVPGKSYIRSLLKGDEDENEASKRIAPQPTTLLRPTVPGKSPTPVVAPVRSNVKTPINVPAVRTPTVPTRSATPVVRRPTRRTTRPTTTRPKPAPVPVAKKEQTKEELKESIDESISGIEDIMSRSKGGPGGESDGESDKIWGELLDSLKEDKKKLDE
jgi:hypothetical protein